MGCQEINITARNTIIDREDILQESILQIFRIRFYCYTGLRSNYALSYS